MLLGKTLRSHTRLIYRAITFSGGPFAEPSTTRMISYSPTIRQNSQNVPTTPTTQPLPGITRAWFSLIQFRSPLLSESLLFSLPSGTEMVHFPEFALYAYVFSVK